MTKKLTNIFRTLSNSLLPVIDVLFIGIGIRVIGISLLMVIGVPTLVAHAQSLPAASPSSSLAWDYQDTDATADAVTEFLVCLDGQTTAACATVPLTAGVASTSTPGVHTFTYRLPGLTAGSHHISVQACTVGGAQCSSGAVLTFTYQPVLANPANLHIAG